MNQNEFRLYQTLDSYGISFEILQAVPFEIIDLVRYNRHGYLLHTAKGPMALWLFRGTESALIHQCRLYSVCRERRMEGFLYPLPLHDNRVYGKLDERTWFYVTHWPELLPVSYRKDTDLQGMVRRIAEFRRMTMEQRDVLLALDGCGSEHGNLLDVMKNAVGNLQTFAMLAGHRLCPTRFDAIFLKEYPLILEKARQGYELLGRSGYSKALAESGGSLIINDLSRGNVRVNSEGVVYILHFKNCRYDMGIIDLAILLIKSGRSNQWSKQWFHQMLEWYQAYFSISPEEYEIIKALLHFPWNIYRLAKRYYFNRTEWSVFRYLDKLERQLADAKCWLAFVNEL